MLTETQRLIAWGAIINSALYLVGLFSAGAILGVKWAAVLAIASAGATYLAYCVRLDWPQSAAGGLINLLAIALASTGGVVLVLGVI